MTAQTIIPSDVVNARRWLWRTLIVLLVGTFVGVTWDRIWHATEPFDGFWSPPHLVVYATVTVVALLGMYLLFSDRLRPAFGRGFRVFFLPFEVPGALFITGSALGILGFAGAVLDNAWHSAFGLNETNWSFPHAMLGTALLMLTLGFLSCRLNMQGKPIPMSSKVILAVLVCWLAQGVFTGPIGSNRTPESVAFFFTYIPAMASQESAQAVFRIYDTFNLNRTHPALLLLAPLWLGAALAFLRALDKRWWFTLIVMFVVTVLDYGNRDFGEQIAILSSEGNIEAIPAFTSAILFVVVVRWRERLAYALAGFLMALMIWGIWEAQSWAWIAALLSPLVTLIAKPLGTRAYQIIAQPYSFEHVRPLIGFTVFWPLITGMLDLWLRAQLG